MSHDEYYSPEQLEYLARRGEEIGEDRIRQVEAEWQEIFSLYRSAMEAGLDPGSREVRALARRSAALIEEFTGGDPGIREALGRMYAAEGGDTVLKRHGMGLAPGVWAYMSAARQELERRGREGRGPADGTGSAGGGE